MPSTSLASTTINKMTLFGNQRTALAASSADKLTQQITYIRTVCTLVLSVPMSVLYIIS